MARLNYSVQQSERDLARLKAQVEALERHSERLEARLATAEGQAREIGRLRGELLEYREDVKRLQVEMPQKMGATVQKMLTDSQTKTIAQVEKAIASRPAQALKQSGYNHEVASGQTLSLIAREYKTTVNAIMKANNLQSANNIRVGQTLFIPAD
jgi:roadblock/LC7 domain-containing protein